MNRVDLEAVLARAIARERPQSDRCDPEEPCRYCHLLARQGLAALEAAGYAIYRPEDCATVFVDSCHHGHDDCQWLEIPAPHSDPGPHSLVPLGGDA